MYESASQDLKDRVASRDQLRMTRLNLSPVHEVAPLLHMHPAGRSNNLVKLRKKKEYKRDQNYTVKRLSSFSCAVNAFTSANPRNMKNVWTKMNKSLYKSQFFSVFKVKKQGQTFVFFYRLFQEYIFKRLLQNGFMLYGNSTIL